MDHLSIPDASGLTGVLIAVLTLVGVLYTQRQARRAAAHDDFRDDFRILAESLRKEIARLDQRVTELRTELDQHQVRIQAQGKHSEGRSCVRLLMM
ncbi:hypothetical protein [Actinacidiphila oryziradicis]|uniref:Uncharacterized protein n=1 Tax=Actinacidiphila oryziradicis TaxID=2571141 RepID=A0A4U0RDJ9_9ACTN|nr:hypothetical protein [Actinacidiphila oryziradicis]TJZ93207.1 hypothetical protein FCI23_54560 [Actinacidiphila oryziradicis]